MINTDNVAKFISRTVQPTACSYTTMDVDRWSVELEYPASGVADAAVGPLGAPDWSLLGLVKRWSFAGTTVVQRGRKVTVSERF